MTWGQFRVPGDHTALHGISRGDGGVYLGLLGVMAFRLFNPARS